MKRKLFVKFTIALVTNLIFYVTNAQDIDFVRQQSQHLLGINDLENAKTSFHRLAFFGDSTDKAIANLQLGSINLHQEHYDKAGHFFLKATNYGKNDSIRTEAFYLRVYSFMLNHHYDLAISELNSLGTGKTSERYYLYSAVAYFMLGETGKSRQYFDTLSGFISRINPKEIDSLFTSYKKRKRRVNPAIASVLSAIVPGSGQAYSGEWGNAGKSFTLNSFFAAVTIYTGYNYGVIKSLVSAFPWFARYYTSGIKLAEQAAIKRNESLKKEALRNILREYQ